MSSREVRIPTIFGLFLAVGGLISGLSLVQNQVNKNVQASAEDSPKTVTVSNITDNEFVVSWITNKATVGFVQYGENQNYDRVVTDDRDQERGSVQASFTHLVTIKNLKPATTYRFKVGAGKQLYDLEGVPYQAITGPIIDSPPPEADVAYGQVVTASAEPAEGSIVYVRLAGGVIQAAMVKNTGSWVIPLSTMRTSDLNSFLSYDKSEAQINLFVQGGVMGTSTAIITTKADSPVYEIMLGKNYESATTANHTEVVTNNAVVISPGVTVPKTDLKILTPQQNEGVNSLKPQIVGEAPSGTEVTVEIHSPSATTGKTTADDNGTFTYSVPQDLAPGEHTITLTAIINGVKKTITRSFVVYAAGESGLPAYSATPSATIAVTPKPTATIIPTVTPKPIVTPKPTVTPKLSPTVKPTATPMVPTTSPTIKPTTIPPTPTLIPTPITQLPKSGGGDVTWWTLVGGLVITCAGVLGLKKSFKVG
jgi:hypothetical protein